MGSQVPARGAFPVSSRSTFYGVSRRCPRPPSAWCWSPRRTQPATSLCYWRAARALGIANDAATDADGEQLVEIGERSAVPPSPGPLRHLFGSVRGGAPGRAPGLGRRPWTRRPTPTVAPGTARLATAGPDEEVASELERSASRAQSRGGLAAAAAFLQRSVALTQDPQRRADRALAAAQAHIQAGAFDEALRLLAAAETDAQNELQRARTDLLRGQIALAAGPVTEASAQLLKAARRLEPLDVSLARETYLDALAAALYAGQPRK